MTTNLGEAILVKTLIGLCDSQCGGEATLTTDEVYAAYAVVTPTAGRFIEQDCETVEKHADGTIVIRCGAVEPDGDVHCDGTVRFTKADLNEAYWTAPTDRTGFMQPMEREG